MHKDKHIGTDARLDLSLYIEGLLTVEETERQLQHDVQPVTVECEAAAVEIEPAPQTNPPAISEQATASIDCLVISIAGMKLLIPANRVAFVERVNQKITRLPVENAAFKGIMTFRERSVAVIDIFALIHGENSESSVDNVQAAEQFIQHAVIMEDARYAIACDDVEEMVSVHPESVRWNKSGFKNRFYSGIVLEQLSPLLNLEQIDSTVASMPFVQSLPE